MDEGKMLTYHYDQGKDILYASLGEFSPSVCVEQGNGLLLRKPTAVALLQNLRSLLPNEVFKTLKGVFLAS